MTTIQSGTAPMISDASPVGTWRSATKRIAFAPGQQRADQHAGRELAARDAQDAAGRGATP